MLDMNDALDERTNIQLSACDRYDTAEACRLIVVAMGGETIHFRGLSARLDTRLRHVTTLGPPLNIYGPYSETQ